jgi:hypothetical protein
MNTQHGRQPGHPLERALAVATRWTLFGALASLALLSVPASFTADHRLTVVVVHLSVLVGSATALSWRLTDMVDEGFFPGMRRRWLASAVSIVALVVGYAALVTLASSAALRYDPSLQFLQLLSALDVAWSAAAFGLGVRVLARSDRAARAAALALDVICVFSIWNYLRVVGFDADGGWIVDRSELLTLVIPFDVAAAVMAIGALLAADRGRTPVGSRR